MRRAVVSALSLLLLAAVLTPAHAVDSTITVRERPDGAGTAYFASAHLCAVGGGAHVPLLRVEKDDPPPPVGLGTRVWGWQPPASSPTGQFYGMGVQVADPSELDTFEMQVYGTAGAAAGRRMIFAFPAGIDLNEAWIGRATLTGGGDSWTTVSGASPLTYKWDEYNTSTWSQTGSHIDQEKTLSQFIGIMGASTDGYLAMLGFGCDGDTFYFDGFRYGSSGNVTTLDFEALTSQVTMSATPQTITAGRKSTLGGDVAPAFVGGTAVHLEVKAYGSDQWTEVAVVTSSDSGALARKVGPLRRAEYRWVFVGEEFGDVYADDTSPVQVIRVRTGLTAVVTDPTIQRGQKIVVVGATKPAKPGQVVTLWRKTSTGKVQLAAATVRSDGTYKVSATASRRGEWKVFTTIPASPGNLAGTSLARTVKIS